MTNSINIESSSGPAQKRVHFESTKHGTLVHTEIRAQDKTEIKKRNYLATLLYNFPETQVRKSLKDYFWAFRKEIKAQDEVIFKTFEAFFLQKINLEEAKAVQNQLRIEDPRRNELTKLIQQQEKWLKPFEEQLQKVNKAHKKEKDTDPAMRNIYKTLHVSKGIKLEDTEHVVYALSKLKSSEAPAKKRFLAQVIAWLQWVIAALIEKFSRQPKTPVEQLIKNLKKRLNENKDLLNNEYQKILSYSLLNDSKSRLANIPSIADMSELKLKAQKEIKAIQKSLDVDIGRSRHIFKIGEDIKLETSPITVPVPGENNQIREERIKSIYTMIEDFTSQTSAAESLVQGLISQTGIAPSLMPILNEVYQDETQSSRLGPSGEFYKEEGPLTYTTTKKDNIIHIEVTGTLAILEADKDRSTLIGTYIITHVIDITDMHTPSLSTSVNVNFKQKNDRKIKDKRDTLPTLVVS